MALSIDWTGKLATPPYGARITVPQADLTFISGTLYELDTDAFRLELKSREDDVDGMPFHDTHVHTTEYTVVGITYARSVVMLSEVIFEDTGSQYSVRLAGSNNDVFDVDGGILIPTDKVTVISTNSAGLIVTAVSGLTGPESAQLNRIDNGVFGQKILNETLDPVQYAPGSGVPGFILLYDDTADPDDSGTWVLLGHKPIWADDARSVGWTKADPIMFEGAIVAGPPPP